MAHTHMEIEAFVRTLVAEIGGIAEDEIQVNDHLTDDLGMDSLQSMELLSRVSEEYEIDPDMDEVLDVVTVAQIVAMAERYLAAA